MRRYFYLFLMCLICLTACGQTTPGISPPSTEATPDISPPSTDGSVIDLATYKDKLQGGWVGQMAGVTWGAPTEFQYMGRIVPEDEVVLNESYWGFYDIRDAYDQDDLYVEIPFLDTMKEQGVNASWVDFGESFQKTKFRLWHANLYGRENLRAGILAPDSGHYLNNPHADDIDWQIEADFAGMVTPGQPQAAIDIAWRAGHVMNYGDGVYGGVVIAAMHSVAYFAENVEQIIEAGRQAAPQGSEYRQVIEDMIAWHAENPTDWQVSWGLLQDKWGHDDRCPDGLNHAFNIDAKLNGAYIFMGLLYGKGDFEESMRIAMRGGQDSDCNPSSVGSILGNWIGFSNIPEKFKSNLSPDRSFRHTDYTYNDVIELNINLAREILLLNGGQITGSGDNEVWHIPSQETIIPPILEQWPDQPNDPPQLTISLEGISGRTITLHASATDPDGILSYQWFFGDLSYGNGPDIKHTYLQDGGYEVIGYVADSTGNTAWKMINVQVGSE